MRAALLDMAGLPVWDGPAYASADAVDRAILEAIAWHKLGAQGAPEIAALIDDPTGGDA
jgi:hypothetical protein